MGGGRLKLDLSKSPRLRGAAGEEPGSELFERRAGAMAVISTQDKNQPLS